MNTKGYVGCNIGKPTTTNDSMIVLANNLQHGGSVHHIHCNTQGLSGHFHMFIPDNDIYGYMWAMHA